jgi:hypothetical protein
MSYKNSDELAKAWQDEEERTRQEVQAAMKEAEAKRQAKRKEQLEAKEKETQYKAETEKKMLEQQKQIALAGEDVKAKIIREEMEKLGDTLQNLENSSGYRDEDRIESIKTKLRVLEEKYFSYPRDLGIETLKPIMVYESDQYELRSEDNGRTWSIIEGPKGARTYSSYKMTAERDSKGRPVQLVKYIRDEYTEKYFKGRTIPVAKNLVYGDEPKKNEQASNKGIFQKVKEKLINGETKQPDTPKIEQPKPVEKKEPVSTEFQHWDCPRCSNRNYFERLTCTNCRNPRPEDWNKPKDNLDKKQGA